MSNTNIENPFCRETINGLLCYFFKRASLLITVIDHLSKSPHFNIFNSVAMVMPTRVSSAEDWLIPLTLFYVMLIYRASLHVIGQYVEDNGLKFQPEFHKVPQLHNWAHAWLCLIMINELTTSSGDMWKFVDDTTVDELANTAKVESRSQLTTYQLKFLN
jgi:hypothetical protein